VRCSSCEPLLDAYLETSLRPIEARAVTAHLRSCGDCTALLGELRVVDALLATTRPPGVAANFTAAVVSATRETPRHSKRRTPLGIALLLYLGVAWALAFFAVSRSNDVAALASSPLTIGARDLAAVDAVVRALAPATPVAAAAVTAVLLIDVLLIVVSFYGYRRVRPILSLYLSRDERS
jgi:anti-sigma factor RsiW